MTNEPPPDTSWPQTPEVREGDQRRAEKDAATPRTVPEAEPEKAELRTTMVNIAGLLGYDLGEEEIAEQDREHWMGLASRIDEDFAHLARRAADAEAERDEARVQLAKAQRLSDQLRAGRETWRAKVLEEVLGALRDRDGFRRWAEVTGRISIYLDAYAPNSDVIETYLTDRCGTAGGDSG